MSIPRGITEGQPVIATEPTPDVLGEPVYWFVKLELAVMDGDHEAAAEAQGELAKLGVVVRYGRPRCDEVSHAN
jgi:hypothetical protein